MNPNDTSNYFALRKDKKSAIDKRLTDTIELKQSYKDSLFRLLYSENPRGTEFFAELYSALMMEGISPPPRLTQIRKVEVKNPLIRQKAHDIAYWYDMELLVMIEHQSTFCANMAFRFLLYASDAYKSYIVDNNLENKLFTSAEITIPQPSFLLLYNGRKDLKSDMVTLSGLYKKSKHKVAGELELKVDYVDVRLSSLTPRMKECKSLLEYSEFVDMINSGKKAGEAIKYFNDDSTPLGYLFRQEGVIDMVKTEFDIKEYVELEREASRAEGKAEGVAEGIAEIVKHMKTIGMTNEDIAKYTGLSLEKVKLIK